MAALPWMPLYPADYLADTAHLTRAQSGSYMLLLMNYWQTGKALDNSGERLASVARMSSEEWAIEKPILAEFFTIKRGKWIHKRVENDLQKVFAKSTQASHAASTGARKRANERLASAQRNLSDTDTDTDTDTDKRLNTFETFWVLYPKQPKGVGSKKSAKAKYAKIVKTVDPGILLEGLQRFILTKPDIGYIPYVTTWLNGERWNDEVLAVGNTLPHLRIEDFNGPYCQSCNQTWPCLTEQKKSENLF